MYKIIFKKKIIRNQDKMTFKTIPRKLKITNKRFCIVFSIILLFLIFNIILLQISFYCLPIVLKHKISKLCLQYERQEISGNLCSELCTRSSVSEFICPPSNYKNNALFMCYKNNEVLVFKEANSMFSNAEDLVWQDNVGYKHYPKEDEFLGMIRRMILFKYNKTLDDNEIKAKFYPKNGLQITNDYMTEMWQLVHDNEFMLITLSEYSKFLPKIYGTCGTIYATQKVDSLELPRSFDMFRFYNTEDLKKRVILALAIIEFLLDLEYQEEPLSVCDLSLNSFGIFNGRLKLISLKHVHPTSIVDRKLSDGKVCFRDSDCYYKNCQTICHNNRCIYKQLNNNFQIACNKIFKGTNYRPGLLITTKTPTYLLHLIDMCAMPVNSDDFDPHRRIGASMKVIDQIYAFLKTINVQLPN